MTTEWLKKVHASALCSIETLEATYDICRSAIERNVLGDFVECGVYAGSHPSVMARAITDCCMPELATFDEHRNSWFRRIHLFDTFNGIPQCGEHDDEFRASGVPANHSACSLEQVKANIAAWGLPEWLFVFHEGDFKDTMFPAATRPVYGHSYPQEIAVLRLDGDLFQSTKVCLDCMLPMVSRGGWVCVDDFNLSGCRKAVLEQIVPAPIYWRVPTK